MINHNILYLSLNSSYSHTSLAYGQLRSISEKFAPQWKWTKTECSINDSINGILLELEQVKPDLLVSTLYLFNRNFALDLFSKFAAISPKTVIILGGPEFLGNNSSFLSLYPFVSAVFRGDESSFPDYLNLVSSGNSELENIRKVKGICFCSEGDYFDGGTAVYPYGLDILPSPYSKGYIHYNRPFVQVETSRGCPSKCSFCTSSLSGKTEYYSLDRIFSDLAIIRNKGIKEIRILDRTFNIPSERAVKLLKIFSENFSDIRFHLEFNPSNLSEKVVEQLKKSPHGQFHIETGIQTFYRPALNKINRMSSSESSEEGLIKLVNIEEIEVHSDLIYGLPEQTSVSCFHDIRKLIQIGPDEIQLESLKVLPGTPIRESADLIYSPTVPYDVLSTKMMTLTEIVLLSSLSKIIDSYYNVDATKSLFQFAVINDNLFLEKFLKFSSRRFSEHHGKPSPKARFKLFFEFAAETKDDLLYSITLFTYFCSGNFQNSEILPKVDTVYKKHRTPGTGCSNFTTGQIELIKKDKLLNILNNYNDILWSDNHPTIENLHIQPNLIIMSAIYGKTREQHRQMENTNTFFFFHRAV